MQRFIGVGFPQARDSHAQSLHLANGEDLAVSICALHGRTALFVPLLEVVIMGVFQHCCHAFDHDLMAAKIAAMHCLKFQSVFVLDYFHVSIFGARIGVIFASLIGVISVLL